MLLAILEKHTHTQKQQLNFLKQTNEKTAINSTAPCQMSHRQVAMSLCYTSVACGLCSALPQTHTSAKHSHQHQVC